MCFSIQPIVGLQWNQICINLILVYLWPLHWNFKISMECQPILTLQGRVLFHSACFKNLTNILKRRIECRNEWHQPCITLVITNNQPKLLQLKPWWLHSTHYHFIVYTSKQSFDHEINVYWWLSILLLTSGWTLHFHPPNQAFKTILSENPLTLSLIHCTMGLRAARSNCIHPV
jgi:hypothetical protein